MASQDSVFEATRAALRSDGIFIEREHLPRRDVVQQVIELAQRRQHVVLGSPPATGKTSLLQLIKRQLRDSETAKKVLQIPLNQMSHSNADPEQQDTDPSTPANAT